MNNTSVLPVHSVRDLGVYIDADPAMKSHITATVKACFAALQQIRSVLSLNVPLADPYSCRGQQVNYCNSLIAGISGRLMDRLQSILNAV